MPQPKPEIRPLTPSPQTATQLAALLTDVVAVGGSVGFMHPIAEAEARAFWTASLEAARGERFIWGAFEGEQLLGTGTLLTTMPPNQPHRAELAKMMTRPHARGRGVASALAQEALAAAVQRSKTLGVLDTAADEGTGPFYETMGFTLAGEIPDFALKPHGGLTGTQLYWKRLARADS